MYNTNIKCKYRTLENINNLDNEEQESEYRKERHLHSLGTLPRLAALSFPRTISGTDKLKGFRCNIRQVRQRQMAMGVDETGKD